MDRPDRSKDGHTDRWRERGRKRKRKRKRQR